MNTGILTKKGILKSAPVIFVLSLFFASFLCASCQRVKEPSEKKATQPRSEELKQGPSATEKVREKRPEGPSIPQTAKIETQKKPNDIPSPLTEEEQKLLDQIGENVLIAPTEYFESQEEASPYLRVLLKGNHRNIKLYKGYEALSDEKRKQDYDVAMSKAIAALNPKTEEGLRLLIEALKTKKEYPRSLAVAARAVKVSKDKSVIPLLRQVAKSPSSIVKLEAAGALLILGDADTALPVLDALVEQGKSVGALYYLFRGPGKIIDERGYKIVEKALNSPKSEVKISAVKLLLDAKKINKEKAGEVALGILHELKAKTLEDYGLTYAQKAKGVGVIPLPGVNIDVGEAHEQERSDGRACDYTMSLLGRLKSKRALPILRHVLKNNTEWWYVCWSNHAKDALLAIEGEER